MPPSPHHTRSRLSTMVFGISSVPDIGIIGDGQNFQHSPQGYRSDATGSITGYSSIQEVTQFVEGGGTLPSAPLGSGLWDYDYADSDPGEPSWATSTPVNPPGTGFRNLTVGLREFGGVPSTVPPIKLQMRIAETTANATRKRCGFSEFEIRVRAIVAQEVYEDTWIELLDARYDATWKKGINLPVPTMRPDASGEKSVRVVMSNAIKTVDTDTFVPQAGQAPNFGLPLEVVADMQSRFDAIKTKIDDWIATLSFNMHFVAIPRSNTSGLIY